MNEIRSKTAEIIINSENLHIAKSAGTSPNAKVNISAGLIQWSEIIFVMEEKHKTFLLKHFGNEVANKQIINLDIDHEKYFMEPELISSIKSKTKPYLNI